MDKQIRVRVMQTVQLVNLIGSLELATQSWMQILWVNCECKRARYSEELQNRDEDEASFLVSLS